MTKQILFLFFFFLSSYVYSLDLKEDVKEMEELEVEGTIDPLDRAYTQQDGKRFITNPYGVKKRLPSCCV